MKMPLFYAERTNLDLLRERQKYLLEHATGYEWQARRLFKKFGEPVWMQMICGFYIVDFLGKDRPFVLELDDARHEENTEYDDRRSEFLESFGLTVFRLQNEDVNEVNIAKILKQVPRTSEGEVRDILKSITSSPEVYLWQHKPIV